MFDDWQKASFVARNSRVTRNIAKFRAKAAVIGKLGALASLGV